MNNSDKTSNVTLLPTIGDIEKLKAQSDVKVSGVVISGSFGKQSSPVDRVVLVAPTLEALKSRQCSPLELQLALVKLIEHHNELSIAFNQFKEEQETPTLDERMNTTYGL